MGTLVSVAMWIVLGVALVAGPLSPLWLPWLKRRIEGVKEAFLARWQARTALEQKLRTRQFPQGFEPTHEQIKMLLARYDDRVAFRKVTRQKAECGPPEADECQRIADIIFSEYFNDICRSYDRAEHIEAVSTEPA